MERVRPHEPPAGQRDRSSELELFSGQFAQTVPEEVEDSEEVHAFSTDSPVCISCGTTLAPPVRVRYPPIDPVTSRFCPKCGAERNAWVAQRQEKRQDADTRKTFMKGMVISLGGAVLCVAGALSVFTLRSRFNIDLPWFETALDALGLLTTTFLGITLLFKFAFQMSDPME